MPLNFKQRAIFVYLRGKNDHKSCTPAGAKLTNEYTHRTNKNDPCTVSVIPSQLCTFFRKRTIPPDEFSNISGDVFDFLPKKWRILRTYHLILPKFHLILPKNFSFPPEEIEISSGTIWKIPRRKSESIGATGNIRLTCQWTARCWIEFCGRGWGWMKRFFSTFAPSKGGVQTA